ncbi:lytic murein transglycosylase [Nocardioides ferulae]|uniref:lytic murein transglycosylase n=1 Tax=Nocardioides ferulae TaxID=2340821 RepID=UPI001F0CD418|nr:lytic murein transglycosylase [Nocardioides ferulae]
MNATRNLLPAAPLAILAGLVAAAVLLAGAAVVSMQRPDREVLLAAPAPHRAAPPAAVASEPLSRGGDRRAPTVPVVDEPWLAATAQAAGMSVPALRAYARATLRAPEGCDLGWTTLAGVGWVESAHGTIGGRVLGEDGRPSSPILGPALDGRGPVAAIPATAGSTAWHGNPDWDHAMGPMQFIPSTWETWASDGDGDGRSDPHDLDDAAYAAARYLCADGHDLATGAGWSAAVHSYNHDDAYVEAVRSAAVAYADRTAG